jgi:DNA-binding MarR family transcriptional regulator
MNEITADIVLDHFDDCTPSDLRVYAKYIAQRLQLHSFKEQAQLAAKFTEATELRDVRNALAQHDTNLTGAEAALLACYYLKLEGARHYLARRLNTILDSFERRPTNLSATLDHLKMRQWLEVVDGDKMNKHKTYSLTDSGVAIAKSVILHCQKKFPRVVSITG